MLENVNLTRELAGSEFKQVLPALQRRLYDLEKACWDNRIPSLVILEGWDAAGKGNATATLTQRLDPRGFKLYAVELPRTFEQQRPWLWRFWNKVPNRGEMVILDRSWYIRVLLERVEGLVPESAWRAAYQDIIDLERMLADDGTVIIKLFFHISRKEQKKRFEKMEADPLEAWRVTKDAWRQNKRYDEWVVAIEEMLERTESEFAPWTIVEATSRNFARKRLLETIIHALEHRLGDKAPAAEVTPDVVGRDAALRSAVESLEHPEHKVPRRPRSLKHK